MPNPFESLLPMIEPYRCKVTMYSNVHSSLVLTLTKSDEQEQFFYVQFSSVRYYSGPMAWTNNRFEIAAPDECLKILKTLPSLRGFSDGDLINGLPNIEGTGYKLYISSDATVSVNIIATGSTVFSPEEYN